MKDLNTANDALLIEQLSLATGAPKSTVSVVVDGVSKIYFDQILYQGTVGVDVQKPSPYRLYPVNFLCDRIIKQTDWRKNRPTYLRRRRGY